MNKRGMTLEAVFWLILAVVGIIIVIYGISKVLSFGCMSTEKEQAKSQVLNFKQFLSNLSVGKNDTYQKLNSPTNWYLISYKKADSDIPTDFFEHDVACICDKEDCKNSYFCEILDQPVFENAKNLDIKIYFTSLNATNNGKFYDVSSIVSK
jgi:uncharacterized membrane protein